MFEVVLERDAKVFLDKYGEFLREKEVEHNLILAVCNGSISGKYPEIYSFAVLKEGQPCLAAVYTPPHHLILSENSGEGLKVLAQRVADKGFNLPGILGPSNMVKQFADALSALTNKKYVENMRDLVYKLDEVVFQQNKIAGEFSFAQVEELDFFVKWNRAFLTEALPDEDHICDESSAKNVKAQINAKKLAVWRVSGEAVSCAKCETYEGMARMGFVYTPPELRGNGYASAVVSHLSQYALDNGARYCCLYADARNKASNSIYKKMGYKLVSEVTLYLLEKQG